MIEDLGIWLFSGPGVVRRLLVGVIIAIAIGVAIAPAIAAARWAARGRTRLVRPSCRHCRALLGEVADGAIAERCPECGRSTSARGAVRWTTRGSRVFSLTVTLPTMLLAACGIGFLVHLTLRTGIDLWRQSLDGALREATRQASRDAVLARLEAIERGERSDLDGMLAFHLNQVEGTSLRLLASGSPVLPAESPFLTETRRRIDRLLGDPEGLVPRRVPPSARREGIGSDLLAAAALLVDDAQYARLLGPIRIGASAEVTAGVPAPIIVEPERFAWQVEFEVDRVLVDGQPVPARRDGTGNIRSGCLWTPPGNPQEMGSGESARLARVEVQGWIVERANGFIERRFMSVRRAFDVRIGARTMPVLTASADPTGVPDPCASGTAMVEAGFERYDGIGLGRIFVQAAQGIAFSGTLEVEQEGRWIPLAHLRQSTTMVAAQWFIPSSSPPASIRVRIRRGSPEGPCVGVDRRSTGQAVELRSGSWTWELFPERDSAEGLQASPVGNTRYVGALRTETRAAPDEAE
jgi:hypothetical protein